MENSVIKGLPAHIRGDCRVLVLGSMPGVASLQAGRYYAHPRNRFWPLMARLCGFDTDLPYPARVAAMLEAGAGLWDVIDECVRPGSLDSAIVPGSATVNPLAERIAVLPQLVLVACNGATAAQAFRREVLPQLPEPARFELLALPSTSPANAAFSLERLFQAWRRLQPHLAPP